MVVTCDPDTGAVALGQTSPLDIAECLGGADLEDDFGSGVRRVGVLTTRTSRRPETPDELAVGNDQISVHDEPSRWRRVVRHGSTVDGLVERKRRRSGRSRFAPMKNPPVERRLATAPAKLFGEGADVSEGVVGRLPRNKGFIAALLAVLVANVAIIAVFQGDGAEAPIERIDFQEPSTTAATSSTTTTSPSTTVRATVPTTSPDLDDIEDSLDSAVDSTETPTTVTPPTTRPPVTQPRTTRPPTTSRPTTAPTTNPPTTAAPATTPPTIPDVTFPEPTVLPGG